MFSIVTEVLAAAASPSTTSGVSIGDLPPILQYGLAVGAALSFVVASAVAVVLGLRAKQTQPHERDKSGIYFDSPQVLQEVRNNRDDIRRVHDKIDFLRETVIQLINAMRDDINSETRSARHGLSGELKALCDYVEDEGSKGRALVRDQFDRDQNNMRMMEGNILTVTAAKADEINRKLEEKLARIAQLAETIRRRP